MALGLSDPLTKEGSALRCLLVAVLVLQVKLLAAVKSFSCYNNDFLFEKASWDQAIVEEKPARLFMARTWEPQRQSQLPVTVATHLTVNRWRQLAAQCRSWSGPLVAAAYLPIVQAGGTNLNESNRIEVGNAMKTLDNLVQQMESEKGCSLKLMLFWEVFSDGNSSMLYPYNTLRNYAILQVQTPLLAMIDVDLLINAGLSKELEDPARAASMIDTCRNRSILILPAFEANSHGIMKQERRLAHRAIHEDKESLHQLYRDGEQMLPFHIKRFALGHNATEFERWFGSATSYSVQWQFHYEPWFIIDRRLNPWYDVRFRGYFFDKVMHVAGLHFAGFDFRVHPSAFLVHGPHELSEALRQKKAGALDAFFVLAHTKAMAVKKQMQAGAYQPRVDEPLRRCAKELPWWKAVTA